MNVVEPVSGGALGSVYVDFFNEIQRQVESSLTTLATRLNVIGQYRDSLEISSALIKQGRNVTIAQCLAVDSLLKMGECAEAISRLAEIVMAGVESQELATLTNDALIMGVGHFNKLIEQRAFESAMTLAENMIVLAPNAVALIDAVTNLALVLGYTEKYHAGLVRATELRMKEFQSLIKAADKCYEKRDFEEEIRIRLQIFRNPLDLSRIPAFRVDNIYLILSRLFIKPMDSDAILLAKELVSHIPSVSNDLFQEPLDQVVEVNQLQRHTNYLNLSLSKINISTVFSTDQDRPRVPELNFFTCNGEILTIEELKNLNSVRSAKVGFFTGGSRLYFETCGTSYVESILTNCDLEEVVLLCATGGWAKPEDLADIIRVTDPRLIFCVDDFMDNGEYCVYGPDIKHSGKIPHQYACCGLLNVEKLLSILNIPIILSGLDTVLQRGVADLLEKYHDADVVLNKVDKGHRLGSYFVNSLELINPTPIGKAFARFIGGYVGNMLSARLQPFAIDQQCLVLAWQNILYRYPEAHIETFSEFDVNNVMFNTENIQDHIDLYEKFRFINIFKDGQKGKSLK